MADATMEPAWVGGQTDDRVGSLVVLGHHDSCFNVDYYKRSQLLTAAPFSQQAPSPDGRCLRIFF
jgi:hypothetical protein